MICSLGAPLHLEHKQELERRLPGRFYELYGLTEGFVTILDRDDYHAQARLGRRPAAALRDADRRRPEGSDLPAGEVGEIVGRGPITMPGYYKRPELTAETILDGWICTGDLGYVDEDGFLYLVDRKKDLIISGGVNVYPRDIEEVVVRHHAVAEAAVFGVADERWGETPVAAVTLRAGAAAERGGAQALGQRARRGPLPEARGRARPRLVPAQRGGQDAAAGDQERRTCEQNGERA